MKNPKRRQPGKLERSYLKRGSVPQVSPLPDSEIQTVDGDGSIHIPDFDEAAENGDALRTAEGLAEDEPLANDSI